MQSLATRQDFVVQEPPGKAEISCLSHFLALTPMYQNSGITKTKLERLCLAVIENQQCSAHCLYQLTDACIFGIDLQISHQPSQNVLYCNDDDNDDEEEDDDDDDDDNDDDDDDDGGGEEEDDDDDDGDDNDDDDDDDDDDVDHDDNFDDDYDDHKISEVDCIGMDGNA